MSGRPSLRPAHSPSPFHKPAVRGRRSESQSEGKTRASWWLSLACGDGSTWHHDVRIAVVGVRMNLNLKEKRVLASGWASARCQAATERPNP